MDSPPKRERRVHVCAVVSPRHHVVGLGAHWFPEAMAQARTESAAAAAAMDKLDAILARRAQQKRFQCAGLTADGYRLLMLPVVLPSAYS